MASPEPVSADPDAGPHASAARSSRPTIATGAVSVVVGVLVLAWPDISVVVLVSGLFSAIGGAVVLVYPEATIVVVTWLAGIVLLVSGVVVLIDGLATRHADRRHAPSSVARPGRAAIG